MLSETAEYVLRRKYYRENETFDSLCIRVATAIGSKEKEAGYWIKKFYQVMRELWFLPGGRILSNADPAGNGNLFNCYVLGVEDSRQSIYEALANSAEIFAHGGGIGINFSNLREYGTPVANGSRASGPVSFMELFNVSADVISQTSRRGAMMGVLNADHPDIYEFVSAKKEEGKLNHFNLSVGLTDEFMTAAIDSEPFRHRSRYYPNTEKVSSADGLLTHIARLTWETGDPGFLFLDTIKAQNSVPHLGKLQMVNPCGEAPLLPYEPCCLGSINLTKMLTTIDGKRVFDSEKLVYTVSIAIRFLDDVHTANIAVLPETKWAASATRKLGLGVMGWADTLAELDIAYDSEEALHLARMIGAYMQRAAYESSVQLAKEKGPYPAFDELESQNIWCENSLVTPTRNAMLLSFAPTGSISLITGVNSGIEPFFAHEYTRYITAGSGKLIRKVPQKIYYPGVKTSHEISPEWHIRHQAVWQTFVDGAISKTINIPEGSTPEDVKEAILLGYKLGLKGMTIFRDKCRDIQILNSG